MKKPRTKISKLVGLLSGLILGMNGSVLPGQVTENTTNVETNLVVVDVLVLDKSVRPVSGLRSEQFELCVDNIRRPIDTFSPAADPVSFGIVFDMHPTTADRTKVLMNSLQNFKEQLRPEDDTFLVAFDQRGEQTFDFIPTAGQLESHMTRPDRADMRSLYDGLFLAADKLRSSRNHRRALFIISDSADHNSRHRFADIQRRLETVNTQVYALIIDENNDLGYKDLTRGARAVYPFSVDATPSDRSAMLGLTLRSGGGMYFGGAKTDYQLIRIYQEIAREMRSQYTLGFYPDVIDSKRHAIKVQLRGVADQKSLVLTYRTSYKGSPNR